MYPEFIAIYIGLAIIIALLIVVFLKIRSFDSVLSQKNNVQDYGNMYYNQQNMYAQQQAACCHTCGTQYDASMGYCPNCGTPRQN